MKCFTSTEHFGITGACCPNPAAWSFKKMANWHHRWPRSVFLFEARRDCSIVQPLTLFAALSVRRSAHSADRAYTNCKVLQLVRSARIASGTGRFRVNCRSFNQGELSIKANASLGNTPTVNTNQSPVTITACQYPAAMPSFRDSLAPR